MHTLWFGITTLMAASDVGSDSTCGLSGIKLSGQPTPTAMKAFGMKFAA